MWYSARQHCLQNTSLSGIEESHQVNKDNYHLIILGIIQFSMLLNNVGNRGHTCLTPDLTVNLGMLFLLPEVQTKVLESPDLLWSMLMRFCGNSSSAINFYISIFLLWKAALESKAAVKLMKAMTNGRWYLLLDCEHLLWAVPPWSEACLFRMS